VLCLCAGAARAQPCEVYYEAFDRFSDPAGFDDGVFAAAWCRAEASVATSSFCNTAGAFRLDSALDDPLLWVFVGDNGCTRLTLGFDYSQFADTQTRVYAAGSIDPAFNCSLSVSQLVGQLTTTGGVCTHVTITLDTNGAQSVYFRFDHGSNTNAVFLDNLSVSLEGCCDGGASHPCDQTGPAGCEDPAVAACVCAQDPYCCDVAWDEICVAETAEFDCVPTSSCAQSFDADFGTLFQSGSVCERFPDLFESCEGAGPYLTTSAPCAGSADVAMRFASGIPYSAAITRCLDLSQSVAPTLSFSYSKDTGTLGPRVEGSTEGGAWATLWTAPFTDDGSCHAVTLDLSALAGNADVRLRFISGSSTGNNGTIDDISLDLTGAPVGDHPPCETGGPGSDDPAVTACVCAADPYCCDTAWDEICVGLVEQEGCGACPDLCLDQFLIDFGDTYLPGDLCTLGPTIFSACEGVGPFLTSAAPAGGLADMAVAFGEGWPYSSFTTRCIDMSAAPGTTLRFEYAKQTNTLGPRVEVSTDAGASFTAIWTAPFSVGAGAHDACVDLSAYAGLHDVRLKFSSGTSLAQSHQIDDVMVTFDRSCFSCPADLTTQGAGAGDPGYGTPDGQVSAADLNYLVNAWVAQDPAIADLTTQGAGEGSPGYGTPDGAVTASDLNYYVNLWLAGCA